MDKPLGIGLAHRLDHVVDREKEPLVGGDGLNEGVLTVKEGPR